jgi:ribonuclease T1
MTAAVRRWPMLLVALVLALSGCGSSGSGSAGSGPGASSGTTALRSVLPTPPPGMPTVALSSLPNQAQEVVEGIQHGGGLKYRQDGTVFTNREGRLPVKPHGYYREYTVATPGLIDRGPRRIITGQDGELYYTPDHYRTFQWIVREGSS